MATNQASKIGKIRIALAPLLKDALEDLLGGTVEIRPEDLTTHRHRRGTAACWEGNARWHRPDGSIVDVSLNSYTAMRQLVKYGVSLFPGRIAYFFEVL